MGEQRSQLQNLELTTISPQNCNTIPKMFEPFKNPNPIVVKDMHVCNPNLKLKKKLLILM